MINNLLKIIDNRAKVRSRYCDLALHLGKVKSLACFCGCRALMAILLIIVPVSIIMSIGMAHAVTVPIDSIAQISVDDEGQKLNYPAAVFFDPVLEEIYLVNGGNGRVVVYGPDFFPRISIGNGRGSSSPRGVTVLENGEVFLCQVRNYKNPSPRITILNGAFFVDREIFLDQIPEARDFRPKQLAVNASGLIYLAGDNERGVLVLDEDGTFLRKMQPLDDISLLGRFNKSEQQPTGDGDQAEKKDPGESESNEETSPEEDLYADVPEEFRPKKRREDIPAEFKDGLGPAKINYVTIDSAGKIYLLSAETGKIYVYGPDENLLFSFGKGGGSPGQLSQPRALAIDENRKLIYVVDYMRHTVLTYNMEGEFLFELGGRGNAPGWFNFPMAIAINSQGHILVADLFNRRLQVLEVGYEDVLPYLELLQNQKKSPGSVTTDTEVPEIEEEAENIPGDDDGDEVLSVDQDEDDTDLKTKAEDEIEIILEAETLPDLSSEPSSSPQPVSSPEPLDIIVEEVIIEEVIIEDEKPAGVPEDAGDQEDTPEKSGDLIKPGLVE